MFFTLVFTCLLAALSGCTAKPAPQSTLSPVEATLAAETVQVRPPALQTTTAPPTAEATAAPTATIGPVLLPATSTPLPTLPGKVPCNLAKFVTDVSVPDGTNFSPGAEVKKTWRLMNTGACPWTVEYVVVVAGENDWMKPGPLEGIKTQVLPGQEGDITVTLQAPSEPGAYRLNFMLMAPSGELFGIGEDGSQPFWMEINVVL